MANNCRAKEPNSCRVHGNGGELDRLQGVADNAATSGNIELYLSTRAQMETLKDDEPTKFIAPDRGVFSIENWKDDQGEIMEEAPNDMLIANLYKASAGELPDTNKVIDILKKRGYEDQDLFLAKHFRFGREDNSSTNPVTARKLSRLTTEIENRNKVRFPPPAKEAFIRKYFDLSSPTQAADREHCKRFIEDYTKFLVKA